MRLLPLIIFLLPIGGCVDTGITPRYIEKQDLSVFYGKTIKQMITDQQGRSVTIVLSDSNGKSSAFEVESSSYLLLNK